MKIKIFKALAIHWFVFLLLLTSCTDYFEPSPNNNQDESSFLERAAFAEGLLLTPYDNLPSAYSFDESATDDAVTNAIGRSYKRMATGEWTSNYNPVSVWGYAYQNILYLNRFLSLVDQVEWSWESPVRNELFRQRFTGEALALRAWYCFNLLKNHGGMGADGNMLGFIILDKYEDISSMDPNTPRSSYDDCVNFILADCNKALSLLPLDYKDLDYPDSNAVFGAQNLNRMDGRAVKALMSRMLLHVASPSLNLNNSEDKWVQAAAAAADLLTDIGGVSGLSDDGLTWYEDEDDPEIIWRRDIADIYVWEQQNFPPSLFGNGRDNPSQNLVDCFPMKNGYPISSPLSGYDAADPYKNRDPRLEEYIVYDGSKIDRTVINTSVETPLDGINNTLLSTVTGYYLKKLMNQKVRLTPGTISTQKQFYTFFRYTEIFFNYAEAANEAWGPDADPNGYGFTPRQIIEAIRARVKISQPDDYLNSITTKEDMRTLIRDERRIELCFEGFRFWDIRRWGLDLTETARGMRIEGGANTIIDVEERAYQPYMKYGPIPYNELLNNRSLIQNEGW